MGRSLSLRFAKAGYNIALISRSKEKTESVAKEINEKYKTVNTLCLSADTSNINECKSAFKQITDPSSKLGRIEVLCFNASYRGAGWPPPAFLDLKLEHVENSFNVGTKGI